MTKSDKRKYFTLKFSIPLKLYEPFENLAYKWRKFWFRKFPFHCDCCGKVMSVRRPQYEYHVPDAKGSVGCRLMVENLVFDKTICRECTVYELETKQWTPRFSHSSLERRGTNRENYRFWSSKKCHITGKAVRAYRDVEILPYIDMTFCTIAWNHSHVSKQAVIDTVKYGTIRTSHWGIWDKKSMAQMNEARLFIDKNGELL